MKKPRWFRLPLGSAGACIPDASVPVEHLHGPGTLQVDRGRLVFRGPLGRRAVLDADRLELLHVYGAVTPTAEAVALAARRKITLAFLSSGGQHLVCRLEPPGNERTLTRMIQHRVVADADARSQLAAETIRVLERLAVKCKAAAGAESLRGFEGAGSAAWFQLLGKLLHKPWRFPRRSRRPPRDPVNSLLSLGYTLLQNRLAARIDASGLDISAGLLDTCDLPPARTVSPNRTLAPTIERNSGTANR